MANSRKSKSNDLTGRVADALLPVVPAGASMVVGLSGGVDSVVLLHLLAGLAPRFSWKLSALHVHHGISPHAGDWVAFCQRICAALGIPLRVEYVDIQPVRHMGVEAAARHLRHAALSKQSVDFIAIAHHQDDQAETLLLQLLRGAGVKGLAAMPAVKPSQGAFPAQGRPALLRPLLDVSRTALLGYAEAHGLEWVEDESNADDSYPRNFLRHRVMPLLAQRFPGAHATLARSAAHFAETSALLDVLAEQDAQAGVEGAPAFDGETLAAGRLAELDAARGKNLLRWFLHQRHALMPESSRLEEMLRQMAAARRDAQICIRWGGWELRHYRGRIYVCPRRAEPDAACVVTWAGEARLPWQGGVLHFEAARGEGLSAEKVAGVPVTIRARRQGEMLRPDPARPARTLTGLFQAHGVPPWLRPGWPLLYCGERLVAVPGIAVDAAWRVSAGAPGVVLKWDMGGKP
jgi:tRNA(Ile)-lysidine synthase